MTVSKSGLRCGSIIAPRDVIEPHFREISCGWGLMMIQWNTRLWPALILSDHVKQPQHRATDRVSVASDLKIINRLGCTDSVITSQGQGEHVSPTFEIEIKVNTTWLKHIS